MKTRYLRATITAVALALGLALGACAERMNREDFATLVKGKAEADVLKNAGKPASVDEKDPGRHIWTYASRTFDVSRQNKTDEKTVVIFTPSPEGKYVVAEVKFE